MVIHSAKDDFYNNVIQDQEIGQELRVLIGNSVENAVNSGLYELCQKYSDISLNAPKIRVDGTCDIQGVFQFTDINKAKEATLAFVTTHNIQDLENLMLFVAKWHSYAVDWDDKRAKSGLIQPENYNWNAGFAGMYYNFQELPDEQMEQIKIEVIEYITVRRK